MYFFFSLFIIDNLIFFFSNYLPKPFLKYLSQKAQINYIIKNNYNLDIIFDEYIYYFRPDTYSNVLVDGIPKKQYNDKYGYSNPKNYLSSEEIELILIGDSYTHSRDFSDSMRSFFKGKVYSLGVGGQGIYHWKHQYLRFKKIYLTSSHPKIIILNYFENDISDTLRAHKYFTAGLTHSAYYPMNEFNDNFKKLNRTISFFDETKSIIKYLVALSKIKENIQSSNLGTIEINKECKIQIDRMDPKKKLFSEYEKPIIKNEIIKMLNLVDFKKTQVFFSYIPAADTIYHEKFTEDELLKNSYSIYKESSRNLRQLFNTIEFPVEYIDLTPQLINIADRDPLHPCNGKDTHFSSYGYQQYAKLLTEEVKKKLKHQPEY